MSAAQADATMVEDGARVRRILDLRTVQRYAAAVILPIPPTLVGIARLFQTDDTNTRQSLDLVAADPDRQFTFALLGFISVLFVIPAFLAAGRVSRRRRPLLTMIALLVNMVALVGGFSLFAIDNLYLIGGLLPTEQRDVAAIVIDKMWSTGIPGFGAGLFVLGHFLGTILLGLALRSSIPVAGWLAMVLTTPAHFLAFVFLQMPAVDMGAWLLMTVAFVFCAIKVVRTPNDEWDLPPLGRPTGAAPS